MALNTLGEREDAPGAAARELAHHTRVKARGLRTLAQTERELGRAHMETAEALRLKAKLARAFSGDELKFKPSDYTTQANEKTVDALAQFENASKHTREAVAARREARKQSVRAFVETWRARLGLGDS